MTLPSRPMTAWRVATPALGETGIETPHILLCSMLAMVVTALTSCTYRHEDSAVSSASVSSAGPAGTEGAA